MSRSPETLEGTRSIKDEVRKHYGRAARSVLNKKGAVACCGPATGPATDASTDAEFQVSSCISDYRSEDLAGIPEDAVRASLGCGNPTALADLHPGETVLDLGSGGGIDVLVSARRVGPDGKAYGLDMTDDMLELARANQKEAGVENVEFLKGTIEEIPLPDDSVDVIVSNCVINLSSDKDQVLREAYRVLKPGGRFAVSDIVWRREPRESIRKSMELWAGCVAGALLDADYRSKLSAAGFEDPTVTVTSELSAEGLAGAGSGCCGDGADAVRERVGETFGLTREDVESLDGALASAFIRATKPA